MTRRLLQAGILLVCVLLVGWGIVAVSAAIRALNAPGQFEEHAIVEVIPAGPNAGGMVLPIRSGIEDAIIVNSSIEMNVLDWTWYWPASSNNIRIEATIQNPSTERRSILLIAILFDLSTPDAIPPGVQKPTIMDGYAPRTIVLALSTPLLPGEIRRITTAVDAPYQSLPKAARSYQNLWINLKRFWRTPYRLWSPGMMLAPILAIYGLEGL